LSQINGANGNGLKLAWHTNIAAPTKSEPLGAGNEAPLVYNGVMYAQDGWMRVTAMDASSGKLLWQFDPGLPLNLGAGSGRSLGMGDGMIFTGNKGTVYALNAKTGAQVWATQLVDPVGGASIDVSPKYYKGLVVLGTAGGDSGAVCIAVALNAKTGKVVWHYSTIPSNPKAYGWKTWPAQRWYFGRRDLGPARDRPEDQPRVLRDGAGAAVQRVDERAGGGVRHGRGVRPERDDGQVRLVVPGGAPRHLGLRLDADADRRDDQEGR